MNKLKLYYLIYGSFSKLTVDTSIQNSYQSKVSHFSQKLIYPNIIIVLNLLKVYN